MNFSLNKTLCFLLIGLVLAIAYTAKPAASKTSLNKPTTDAELCAELVDPSTLSFVSYNTEQGFNECVNRCVTSAMRQVCGQLPENSNVFATQPQIKQQMIEGCTENIHHFVRDNIRCPYVNCEP